MRLRPEIIFSHPQYVVVNKPARLLSVPDRYDSSIPNLQHILQKQYGKIYPVHRLDRSTSGLLLFALDASFFRYISRLFETRQIEKKYLAIVQGVPSIEEGTIDAPILSLPGKNKVVVHARGKASVSRYRLLEVFQTFSLLEVSIESGRTHQIRVHLQSIGHPLLVDPVYGGQQSFFLSEVKPKYRGDKSEERPLLIRTPLHAHHLSFRDEKGEMMSFEAAAPKDMKATLQQFRKLLS